MENLKNKVAIITGGSKGIGAAIAEDLSAKGITVIINYANDTSQEELTVSRITKRGGHVVAIKANVGSTDEVMFLFSEVNKKFGGLDILVNCAGMAYFKPTTIAETSDEFHDEMFNINLMGTFRCLRESIKYLRPEGRIITFSTSGIASAYPGFGVYNASKAAVEILSRTLSRELKGKRITVNCISPGAIATENWLKGKPEQALKAIADLSPFERLGTPKDIAEVVSFLVSREGEWVNGQIIRVNGGFI
ncbi:MAG TPA: SDR family oxidoreductase [Hanamia sp.]